jgi:hypothetical protein
MRTLGGGGMGAGSSTGVRGTPPDQSSEDGLEMGKLQYDSRWCPVCLRELPGHRATTGRPQLWCSERCRQKVFRAGGPLAWALRCRNDAILLETLGKTSFQISQARRLRWQAEALAGHPPDSPPPDEIAFEELVCRVRRHL